MSNAATPVDHEDAGTGETSAAPKLNDVMIAMDVVDTLRHDQSLVERELNDESRRKALIDRLREIYRGQGLEVPDHILEEGVRALEEDRFTYKPPPEDALSTRLARLYVTRMDWGRYVLGALAAIAVLWTAHYVLVSRPQALQKAERARQLASVPGELAKLAGAIGSEAKDPKLVERANTVVQTGRNSAAAGDLSTALAARQELSATLARLREEFDVRIVNERGELSGLWRIPPNNPNAYNFYLVVEAITANGRTLVQSIRNEETGKTDQVRRWAIRVDRDILERVKADKEDDGIIQNRIVGRKQRGKTTIAWTIKVRGGAITRWK